MKKYSFEHSKRETSSASERWNRERSFFVLFRELFNLSVEITFQTISLTRKKHFMDSAQRLKTPALV